MITCLYIEIMDKFNNMKGKQAYITPKLDTGKVYNRSEWDFFFPCQKDMRFHDVWIRWTRTTKNQ